MPHAIVALTEETEAQRRGGRRAAASMLAISSWAQMNAYTLAVGTGSSPALPSEYSSATAYQTNVRGAGRGLYCGSFGQNVPSGGAWYLGGLLVAEGTSNAQDGFTLEVGVDIAGSHNTVGAVDFTWTSGVPVAGARTTAFGGVMGGSGYVVETSSSSWFYVGLLVYIPTAGTGLPATFCLRCPLTDAGTPTKTGHIARPIGYTFS